MPSLGPSAYRQLPAWSPISATALSAALARTLAGRDAPGELQTLLLERYRATGVELLASGTHALQTALSLAARVPEEVVLLPAYTCYEVATAAVGAGVAVALYDLDPVTLGPDVGSVRRVAAGRRVAALVIAPLYGMPIDWQAMRALAHELGAILIEDAAQANGSVYATQPVGSFGDFSILSFGRGKGWTGMGGGALLWRGDKGSNAAQPTADDRTRATRRGTADVRLALAAAAQWALARPSVYGVPASMPRLRLGETVYHEPSDQRPIARFSAALVLATDAMARREAEARRRNAEDYRARLGHGDGRGFEVIGAGMDATSGALRFPLLLAGGWAAVREAGADRMGAGPPYPTTLDRLPALVARLANPEVVHPGAERLVRELVTLPTHSLTRADERARLCVHIRSTPDRAAAAA